MWLSGQLVLLDSPSGGPRFKDVDKIWTPGPWTIPVAHAPLIFEDEFC